MATDLAAYRNPQAEAAEDAEARRLYLQTGPVTACENEKPETVRKGWIELKKLFGWKMVWAELTLGVPSSFGGFSSTASAGTRKVLLLQLFEDEASARACGKPLDVATIGVKEGEAAHGIRSLKQTKNDGIGGSQEMVLTTYDGKKQKTLRLKASFKTGNPRLAPRTDGVEHGALPCAHARHLPHMGPHSLGGFHLVELNPGA